MWWKKHKWKVILPAVLVVILAAVFWYGGAPGLQGWSAKAPEAQVTAAPTQAPAAPRSTETLAPTVTLGPSAEPEPSPSPSGVLESHPGGEGTPESPGTAVIPNDGKNQGPDSPAPTGNPLPVEPQDVTISGTAHSCTLSISCAAILAHMDWLDPEKAELLPADGWILPPTQAAFYEGESVFNVLQRVCKQNGIHMEFTNTPMYNSAYIEGIGNIYEFDCGDLSGWMYTVNGWFPNYGCSRYALQEGDTVCWVYTCDLGADVGGYNAIG